MFQSISESLSQFTYYTVLGFFIAAFYEIIRIIRLFKKQSDIIVGITDFIFLCLAGLITFAYSLEWGEGGFRWFFVFGEAFGAAIYFISIGRLISLTSNLIVKFIKHLFSLLLKYLFVPIRKKLVAFIHFLKSKIVNYNVFLTNRIRNSSKHLKSKVKILYNKETTEKLKIMGEKRNVIKGKIREKT